ncbi:hypothetical protein M9Y10_022249 [Tritrichomonas musculus]|uniref:Uncharacterized protein n=1 Tax=Tritrichomonas musculus TaxID=1915356 RepID=A0ABR2KRQ4_9EUKA
MNDLQNILEIVDEHYTKGNSAPEITNFINSFPTNINSLEICKNILGLTDAKMSCKLFASDSFKNIISRFINYLTFSQASGIVEWITYFLTSDNLNLADAIYSDLSAAASQIFVRFFESQHDDVNRMIGNFTKLFGSNPLMLIRGIQIHSEIISTFGSLNEKKDMATFKNFQESTLYGFLMTAKQILSRLQNEQDEIYTFPPELRKQIISLSCLNLSKTIAFKMEKDLYSQNNDEKFKTEISDENFLIFIFQVFEKFSEPEALKVISSYFQLQPASFIKPQFFYSIFNNICMGLINIIQNQIGFSESSTIYQLSQILSYFSIRINLMMIKYLPSLALLIESTAQFSIVIFQNISNEPNTINNIVTFWSKLEELLRQVSNDPNNNSPTALLWIPIKQQVMSKAFDIYSSYIELLLKEVMQPGNEEIDFNFLSNKISPFISLIQSFVNLNQLPIYQHLMSIYHSKKEEFLQLLANNNQISEDVSKQIALFIQIFIKFIDSTKNLTDPICIESFTEIISLMQITIPALNERNHLSFEIEISFSIFIEKFRSTNLGNSQVRFEARDNFYRRIPPALGISSPQSCQDFFFHRIISTLQGFFGNQYEEILFRNLFNKLDQKVFPSDEILLLFLQTDLDSSLNFLKNYKYRYFFSMSLMSIIGKLENSILYNIFLSNLNAKFAALPNPEALSMLSSDIGGMFSAKLKPEYYHIRFNSLFPDKMKLISDALASPSGQNIQVISLTLKMCKSIVFWLPANKIVFDNNSPNGIISFTFAAQTICTFISFAAPNLQSPGFVQMLESRGYRELKYVSKILSYLLSGGYVPFDAFAIYNDPVFVNVLTGVIQLLTNLDKTSICNHPKTFFSLITFFKELCINQMKTICRQLQPELLKELMIIIFESASKGTSMLENISECSVQIITTILEFIVDEQGTKECETLMNSVDSQILGQTNACLWELLFNGNSNSYISTSIMLFILINKSAFDVIKEKIIQISQDFKTADILQALTYFENQLPSIIENRNSTAMKQILDKLKEVVNQRIVVVSFI